MLLKKRGMRKPSTDSHQPTAGSTPDSWNDTTDTRGEFSLDELHNERDKDGFRSLLLPLLFHLILWSPILVPAAYSMMKRIVDPSHSEHIHTSPEQPILVGNTWGFQN